MGLLSNLLSYPFEPWPLAYVGPGPGLGLLGAVLALVTTLLVCFSAIALWPLRALRRHWRQKRSATP